MPPTKTDVTEVVAAIGRTLEAYFGHLKIIGQATRLGQNRDRSSDRRKRGDKA